MPSTARGPQWRGGVLRRTPARIILSITVTAVLVSLAGCAAIFPLQAPSTSSRQTTDTDSDGGILISSLRPVPSPALTEYYDQRISWHSCDDGLRCGTVKAPVDWQHITSESITLALVEHRAAGPSKGAIVVNPGGPGGSGVAFIADGVENAVDDTLAAQYDVVGFDPRGVGASSPVTCFDSAGTDRYLYGIDPGAIGSATWIAAEKAKSSSLEKACRQGTGPVLSHIDSVSAAEDMELIRRAIGERKLNYLGYSYGTYLGTLYAGLFPDSVGRMVLDGADDPWGDDYVPSSPNDPSDGYGVSPSLDGTVAQAQSFEHDLTDYLKSCLTNAYSAVKTLHCPFTKSVKDAQRQVSSMLAAVARHPLVSQDNRRLGAAALATAIEEPLYDSSDWPKLTKLFVEVKRGDPTQAFALADEYNDREPNGTYDDNADVAYLAIGCVESGPAVDLAFDKREAVELRKVAPILGIYGAYGDLVCSGWPFAAAPFPNPVHAPGTGPILVIGTTGDPATPYADAKSLANQLDGGHLVTMHADEHTAYDLGNTCVDTTVDRYFLAGVVPAKDPDCR